MSDLHPREREDPDWEGAVIDLVEDGEVVGMAYADEGRLMVEFYPNPDGEAHLLDLEDLQRVLDTAAAMLADEAPGGEESEAPAEHPIDILASEFDSLAARRGPEDEGFYPFEVAARLVNRCGDLGLAVVSMEGFTLRADGTDPVPGCSAHPGKAHHGEPWPTFQSGCNVQALAVMERWPRRPAFAVAFEVEDADGEVYVL